MALPTDRNTSPSFDSPGQTVPSTPSLNRRLCMTPAAEVPSLQRNANYGDSPGSGFLPSSRVAMQMERGEQIVFLQDGYVPVSPQSKGGHLVRNSAAKSEQTVPATPPVRGATRKKTNTRLLLAPSLFCIRAVRVDQTVPATPSPLRGISRERPITSLLSSSSSSPLPKSNRAARVEQRVTAMPPPVNTNTPLLPSSLLLASSRAVNVDRREPATLPAVRSPARKETNVSVQSLSYDGKNANLRIAPSCSTARSEQHEQTHSRVEKKKTRCLLKVDRAFKLSFNRRHLTSNEDWDLFNGLDEDIFL